MWIIAHRKGFYVFTGIVVVAALASLFLWGLKFGIDFTGGSLLEVAYTESVPTVSDVNTALSTAGIADASVRPTGEKGYIIRTPFLTPDRYNSVKAALSEGGKTPFEEKQYSSIGPTIGSELKTRAIWAIALVLVAIALFIAFAFRKVSKPVSSWKYGLVVLLALAHDVIVPVGAFAILGHFFGAEVDTLFVTALLVILGFSVHDSIVVFDRVRENLRKNQENNNAKELFEETVGKSVSQTIARSINTSLTVVIVLLVLFFIGPASAHYFVLTLLIGIIAGTYSSIFLGSPLLVTLAAKQKPKDSSKSEKKAKKR
ncbi:MAG: protein translocase subunit SecF [Patescibacteria group bacterium]|nr:protein translocase subunit SecF [Patescibacteria group bacterium]